MTQRSTSGVKIFVFGLVTGLIAVTLLLGAAGLVMVRRGVTVSVDRYEVIDELTTQASTVIGSAIPEMLAQTRKRVPQIVQEQVRSGLGEMSLEIASYQVRLPAAVVTSIDGYLQSTVTAAFSELLNSLESTAVAPLTGDQLRHQVAQWVESLHGRSFPVKAARITVPVTIRLE